MQFCLYCQLYSDKIHSRWNIGNFYEASAAAAGADDYQLDVNNNFTKAYVFGIDPVCNFLNLSTWNDD
jgi:hypothetical protein